MWTSPEAVLLAAKLLEMDPAAVRSWIPLPSIRKWPSFASAKAHGMEQFTKRVDPEDLEDFITACTRLVAEPTGVMVPASPQKWALKMPNGYAVFGLGDQGVTVATKRDKIAEGQVVVENPHMSPQENLRWERNRRAL